MSQNKDFFTRNLLSKTLNPICYKDKNGVFLGVNEIFAREIVGLRETEIIGSRFSEIRNKVESKIPKKDLAKEKSFLEYLQESDEEDLELIKNKGTSTHKYEALCADGIVRTFIVNKSTFDNGKGEVAGIITILQDITELSKVEKILEENEDRYRIVTKQTGHLVYDYEIEKIKISWSGATRELLGYESEDFASTDIKVWLNHIHPKDREKTWQDFNKYIEIGENFRLEYRFRKTDGTCIFIEEDVVCLKNKDGKVNRALGIMKDITGRKLAQEKLETSEEIYRSFIQNFKGIAFQLNEHFLPEFMHGLVEEITGYKEEEFLSGRILWKDQIYPEDLCYVLKNYERIQKASYSLYTEFDFRIIHKNGQIKWVHETYQKIKGKRKRPDKYQGTIYDITGKKETEKALERMEEFRKKEIHHRIKNNLQVISSLLDLQAERFNNKENIQNSDIAEAFRESQDRILSIALIHEELHKGEGNNKLNFSAYLRKLVGNLFQTYKLKNKDIGLEIKFEENVFFETDTAVPLGIIVNELVSNSLKHAFQNREKGNIRIELCRQEKTRKEINQFQKNKDIKKEKDENGSEFLLIVSDDGIGIPETLDIEDSSTLGLQLVTILVDQLDGKIELNRKNGTEVFIQIKVKEREN